MTTVRFRAWTVEKPQEVIMTPDGPVIAERGAVVAVAIGERWEDVADLIKRIDRREDK